MISMLLPPWFVGILTFATMFVALIFWFTAMLPGILLKLLPVYGLQRLASRYCVWAARNWVGSNQLIYRLLHDVASPVAYGEVEFNASLDPRRSYLLLSNHQSWADILILFDVFHAKTPFLRFFLKRDLLWVPIIGLVCWAMDFPFMTRKSSAADRETTRKACAVYRHDPVTVVNFLEGTRFTEAKRLAKRSPYQRLLRPKTGGLAYSLDAMGEQFAGFLDVTVCYQPTERNLLWSWLCGEQGHVRVVVDLIPVPAELLHGDYDRDPDYRARCQTWVNGLWQRKDARLEALRRRAPIPAQTPAHL